MEKKGSGLVQTYGLVNIYYGTTSGNSKQLAYEFSLQAKQHGFVPKVTCLGDFNEQQFKSSTFSVLFLSTYGVGGPTEDSQRFYQWMQKLAADKQPLLSHLHYIVFGLGNSNFQFFAGMSKKIRAFLYQLGAHELYEFATTDAKYEVPMDKFNKWKVGLFQHILTNNPKLFQKKSVSLAELAKLNYDYKVVFCQHDHSDWQNSKTDNLKFEMKNYLSCRKAKVLEVREVRKGDPTRSTLFVRIENTTGVNIDPACNIELFPQNVIAPGEYKGCVQFAADNPKQNIPYPPMPLQSLMKLLNTSQKITKSFLQMVLMTCEDKQKVAKYQNILKDDVAWNNSNISCAEFIKQFGVDLQHQFVLGINTPRIYTLSGWDKKEIHLLVSIFYKQGKMGLTSAYLSSIPSFVRIRPKKSNFAVPSDPTKPIVMIGNGSGMAPFRSLLYYFWEKKKQGENINPITFYYGCQKIQTDYYFRQEWEAAEKEGVLRMRVATSREGQKQYVQKLLEQDQVQVKEYLDQGAIFMVCGSQKMGRDINNVIISVFKKSGTSPYAALMKVKAMQKQGRILKEIYG